MLTAENLKGNWATLLLPIDEDQTIGYTQLADEIDHLVAANVDGIYSNGTAGEFHNQTEQEFDTINEMLSSKCRAAGRRFQIGASHPSPILSLERVQRAVHLQPDAIQVILPDWVKATPAEQVDFLQRIADAAAGIPLVLYNPPHAKTVLTPGEYLKFKKEVPTLIGIKVLSGDDEWIDEMKIYAGHLSIFVPGHLLATGISKKIAAGAYSNVACINPVAAQAWWKLMGTDLVQALDLERRIQEFFKQCIAPYQAESYSNPALDKFLAAVGGWSAIGTRLRWPYRWIPAADIAVVRKQAIRLIPEFFR